LRLRQKTRLTSRSSWKEDGSAVIEIGDDEADEVGFYENLADVIDPDDRNRISIDLQSLFEADKSSRAEWENMYSKGLELLGFERLRSAPSPSVARQARSIRC